jgi:DNA polymerase-3 subunit alpha
MSGAVYTPTHLHSHFSLLDGCIKIPELCDRLVELGLSACALTDHGVLFGIINFYTECKKRNIKPLLGMEAYLTEDPDDIENKTRDNYHLVLIASSNKGLENLIWLSSHAHLHNFYYKPRIYRPLLEQYSEGLIATSACLAGYPARHLIRWEKDINKVFLDNRKEYLKLISWFREVFNGNYYLEVQDHNFWEQTEYNKIIIDIARKENIPLVLTSDAHYLKQEDRYIHEMMMAMQFKQTLEEYRNGNNMKYGGTNYVLSSEEMAAAAKKWNISEALDNTLKIAEQCNVTIEMGNYHLPSYDYKAAEDYGEFQKWLKKKK